MATKRQREARLREFESLHAAYNNVEWDADVRWFDRSRGEGSVRLSNGQSLTLYACNIAGRKTWYPETACVFYTKGQRVRVRTEVRGDGQVCVIGLTQGDLDHKKWNAIKDRNLAFRCGDEGRAITGLLA